MNEPPSVQVGRVIRGMCNLKSTIHGKGNLKSTKGGNSTIHEKGNRKIYHLEGKKSFKNLIGGMSNLLLKGY